MNQPANKVRKEESDISARVIKGYLPILEWGAKYNSKTFSNDMIVALIVTMMLIPQSLAYAILAGLPPEIGLYASMAPLILYAIFGTSRALAVGPVAVASLMTAAAAGKLASQGSPEYLGAAIALAMVSGLLLIAMGLLKLGFLANFLSHPVIAGFITASGIQIAAGQLGPVLGIHVEGESFLQIVISLYHSIGNTHFATAAIGFGSLVFLFWVRSGLKPILLRMKTPVKVADILVKVGPVVAIIATIVIAAGLGLADKGVKIVGKVPGGLPKLALPPLDFALWMKILVPALLISIVGYVESISVALTLAAKKRQRVDPDQELDCPGCFKHWFGNIRWISCNGRLCPVGGKLRGRSRDPCSRSIYGCWHCIGDAVPDTTALLSTESYAGRNYYCCGNVTGKLQRAQTYLGILESRFRSHAGNNTGNTGRRR